MRYVKVFLLVLLFFFIMMFFVQNEPSFSQSMQLTLDLLFFPPMVSKPISVYVLLLICFSLGSMITLLFLVWDRIKLSTRLAVAHIHIRTLEKKLARINNEKDHIVRQPKDEEQAMMED